MAREAQPCHVALRSPQAVEVPDWITTARCRCRKATGDVWQIPATDTLVAYVAWDVSRMENTWRNEGARHACSLAGTRTNYLNMIL